MILIVSLPLSGCGKKVKEPKIEVGGMRFNTQSIYGNANIASIRVILRKDGKIDQVIEEQLPIDDSGIATIDKIPVGYYEVLIDVLDHDGNIIYQTEADFYYLFIERNRYNLLDVVLVPAKGGLLISIEIKDGNDLPPPQGKITTTITGKVIGDGEYSLEGHTMRLTDHNSFAVKVPLDSDGRFTFKEQTLVIAEGLVYNVDFWPDTTKESYYYYGHRSLTVDLDTPGQLDVEPVFVNYDVPCFHLTITADGSPLAEQFVSVELQRNDGLGRSRRNGYTDRNGQIWIPIFGDPHSILTVEITNTKVFEIEGEFLPRTTYSYEIKL